MMRHAAIATLMLLAACGTESEAPASTGAVPTTAPSATVTTQSPTTTLPPSSVTTMAPTTTTTAAPTTTTTTPTTTTTAAPTTTTTAPTTTTTTYPSDAGLTARHWAVVLVTADDVLNVRTGPGVSNSILTTLAPTQDHVIASGRYSMVGSALWMEIETEDSPGWVNSRYLTEMWTTPEVELEWSFEQPIMEFITAAMHEGPFNISVSPKGLYVVYYDDELRHWSLSELSAANSSGDLIEWSSTGCHKSEPGDCVMASFTTAVPVDLSDTYEDSDMVYELDGMLLGAGSMLPEAVIPVPFQNLHYLVVHDPGDDPGLSGMDWKSWFVFYEYVDGETYIIGLSPQAWGP